MQKTPATKTTMKGQLAPAKNNGQSMGADKAKLSKNTISKGKVQGKRG